MTNPIKRAFEKYMHGKQYGEQETLDTFHPFEAGYLCGAREAQSDARSALIEIGHLVLGCDSYPCRVESLPVVFSKDMIAEIKCLIAERHAAIDKSVARRTPARPLPSKKGKR